MNLAILGGGPMALVLARLTASTGQKAHLWLADRSQHPEELQRALPGTSIITGYNAFNEGSWMCIVCVTSSQAEGVLERVVDSMDPSSAHSFIIFTEGILSADLRRRTGLYGFAEYTNLLAARRGISSVAVAAAGGPNLISEIQESAHTFVLLGVGRKDNDHDLGSPFRSDLMHVDMTDDMLGVELGGALKNPIAMAAGIVAGLPRVGSNVLGELVGAGFREMLALGSAMGARPETLYGRAGLSDLLTNAFSLRSRNRTFGRQFVHRVKERVDEPGLVERVQNFFRPAGMIEREMSRADYLAEGGYALGAVIDVAKELDVDVPIYSTLRSVLSRRSPPEALLEHITGQSLQSLQSSSLSAGGMAGEASIHIEEDADTLAANRAIGYLHSLPKGKAIIKAGGVQLPRQKVGMVKEEERLIAILREADGEVFWDSVRSLAKLYCQSISSSLTNDPGNANAIASLEDSGNGHHIVPQVSGDVDDTRRLSKRSAVVYAAMHKSHMDPVELAVGLASVDLPLPRFALVHTPPTGVLWEWIVKGVGGMHVPLARARDVLFTACLRECQKTLIERGVPFLLFPEGTRSTTGAPGAVRSGLLWPVIEAFQNSGREISVVPLCLSYHSVPDDTELCGLEESVSFQEYLSRRTAVHMVIAPAVSVSRIAREDNPDYALAARISAAWTQNARILPHNVVCRVISESMHRIQEKDLEPAIERLLSGHSGNFLMTTPRQISLEGTRILLERKIITVQNGIIESAVKRLVDFYGAPAAIEEEVI